MGCCGSISDDKAVMAADLERTAREKEEKKENALEEERTAREEEERAVVEKKTALIVVADQGNHRVQVLRLEDGSHVRTIGSRGKGPGQFDSPSGVAMDGEGHLIVADSGNERVQVFRLEDGSDVRAIGSRGDGPGQFEEPHGVAAHIASTFPSLIHSCKTRYGYGFERSKRSP